MNFNTIIIGFLIGVGLIGSFTMAHHSDVAATDKADKVTATIKENTSANRKNEKAIGAIQLWIKDHDLNWKDNSEELSK